MACVAVEQALTTPKVGPLMPYSMLTCAEAESRSPSEASADGCALVLLEQHLVGQFERGQAADAGADDGGRAIALGDAAAARA